MIYFAFFQSGVQPSSDCLKALLPSRNADTIHKSIIDLASISQSIACGSFWNSEYVPIILDGSTIIKKITYFFFQNEKYCLYLFQTIYDHSDESEQKKISYL